MSSSNRYTALCCRYTIILCGNVFLASYSFLTTDPPGPPVNLGQNESANTESSAVVQWQSPEETGGRGISISSYAVTVSDDAGHQIMPKSVSDDGRDGAFSHHLWTGLQHCVWS